MYILVSNLVRQINVDISDILNYTIELLFDEKIAFVNFLPTHTKKYSNLCIRNIEY